MKSILSILTVSLLFCVHSYGQDLPNFDWTTEVSNPTAHLGDTLVVSFKTQMPHGLKIYTSEINCEIGPNPSSLEAVKIDGLKLAGDLQSIGSHSEFDDIFECDIYYFKDEAHFTQSFVVTDAAYSSEGALEYQVCLESGVCILQKYQFHIGAE
jgi:hypothetical protein